MGKTASYSDAVPTVKIILQHSRQIQEGEQRYRNVSKIFLENAEGERFLSPTNKPGLAQVYARHLAEGGVPNDDRWNHLKSLCEEYSKMAGFVRAVRSNQFNESAQRLVNEGLNHYQGLRESLSKLRGSRGYNTYFESWTPALMENEGDDQNNLNELFVQETLDPRIESVIPILNKLSKNLGEMKEVSELAEWADSLIESPGAETLAHNQTTEKSRLDAFDLDENDGGQQALNPVGIPEEDELVQEGKPSKTDLAMAYLKAIVMAPTGTPENERIRNWQEKLEDEFDIEMDTGALAQMLPQFDSMLQAGKLDKLQNRMASRGELEIGESQHGVEEGILDTVKKVGGKVLDKLGHGSDEDLLKDLQKKAGVRGPNHGKPSMAQSDVEKRTDEVDMGQADSSLRSEPKQDNGKMDHFTALGKASKKMGHDHYMDVPDDKLEALKAMVKRFRAGEEVDESALQAYIGDKKYGKDGMDALRKAGQDDASEKTMQNIRAEYSSKEEPVTEDGQFAGDFATGEAGQWRNKGPKANKPATVGDLVGEGQEDLAAMMGIVNR
jgi:hypothetical protein